MADPYPQLNVNPFQIPLNVRIVRDANGDAALGQGRRHAVPGDVAVQRQEQHLHRSAGRDAVDAAVERPTCSDEVNRHLLVDVRYVGSRGQDLLGKINLAVPIDPRVTPVNGFTDIYDARGALINPDFFVPAEFLGLNRNGGFQQLTNVGRSTYHSFQTNVRGRFGTRAFLHGRLHLRQSLDTLSSDRSLVEHDPTPAREQLRPRRLRSHAPPDDGVGAARCRDRTARACSAP